VEVRMETSRALDENDELARFRKEFLLDSAGVNYMDGNSLGRLSRAAHRALLDTVTEGWQESMVHGWDSWINLATELGTTIGTSLLGAHDGQVVVSDSTSVNLYKLILAGLSLHEERDVLVVDAQDFPTDRYLIEGIARRQGLQVRFVTSGIDSELKVQDVVGQLDERVALGVFSQVNYRSGGLADLKGLAEALHGVGALLLADLSHSVGVVPIELDNDGVDLATGCTYKYLNGGPGSPAFLYVRSSLQDQLEQPIWGWFSQRDQFEMGPSYLPKDSIEKFLVGTPPVLQLGALKGALSLVVEAGIDAIRAKSLALTSLALALFDERLQGTQLRVASPREPELRGGHVTFAHPRALEIATELFESAGVLVDYRTPDRFRFAPSPLYTRFQDVDEGMAAVARVTRAVESFEHR